MARAKGIYPAPVYEAHFADGSTGRLSFWSAKGKPIDGERGRRVAALAYSRPEGAPIFVPCTNDVLNYPPLAVVRGFIEHPTIGRVEHGPELAPVVKSRTVKAARPRVASVNPAIAIRDELYRIGPAKVPVALRQFIEAAAAAAA